jgi:hypothetical protein
MKTDDSGSEKHSQDSNPAQDGVVDLPDPHFHHHLVEANLPSVLPRISCSSPSPSPPLSSCTLAPSSTCKTPPFPVHRARS